MKYSQTHKRETYTIGMAWMPLKMVAVEEEECLTGSREVSPVTMDMVEYGEKGSGSFFFVREQIPP